MDKPVSVEEKCRTRNCMHPATPGCMMKMCEGCCRRLQRKTEEHNTKHPDKLRVGLNAFFNVETSFLFCSLLSGVRFLLPRNSVSFLFSSFPSLYDSVSRSSFGNWSGRTLWRLHAVLCLF